MRLQLLAPVINEEQVNVLSVNQPTICVPIGRPSRAVIERILDRVTIMERMTRPTYNHVSGHGITMTILPEHRIPRETRAAFPRQVPPWSQAAVRLCSLQKQCTSCQWLPSKNHRESLQIHQPVLTTSDYKSSHETAALHLDRRQ